MIKIDARRVHVSNSDSHPSGSYVLYWMQSAVRAEHNHALEHAIYAANELGIPLLVWVCFMPEYPEATSLHHAFFYQGVLDARESLIARGIAVIIGKGNPANEIGTLLQDAALLVTDDKQLRHQKAWVASIQAVAPCPIHIVETNVIVPVEVALGKEAYSAASLRPHILSRVSEFVHQMPAATPKIPSIKLAASFDSLDPVEAHAYPPGPTQGGHRSAAITLNAFVGSSLLTYDTCKSAPGADCTSRLSPYLHFGHISPCEVFLAAVSRSGPGVDAFVEQLVVRRELAHNFVHYNSNYDSIRCLPDWAAKTLELHARDMREYAYSEKELESCKTHDPYWNAAQHQMMETGFMDGYMRMYWGKKVLEWSESPKEAYATLCTFNNRYELDGRDPNGFAGVAWCFGKHDRPWKERDIFGTVRYMNDRGLLRKFDMAPYVERYGT